MDLKKLFLLVAIEVLFFSVIISGLVFERYEAKNYLEETQKYAPDLLIAKEELESGEPINYDKQLELEYMIKKINDVGRKSNILDYVFVPFVIILSFVLFQVFYWKIAAKTKAKRIIIPSLMQAVLFLIATYFAVDLVTYLLFIEGTLKSLSYFLIFSVLLMLVTLFNFFYFCNTQSIKNTFKIIFKSKISVFLNLIVLMAFFLLLIILATLCYIFFNVNISLISPIILLITISIIANIQRIYLISKIKR